MEKLEFRNLWSKIPEKQKKIRVERAYNVLRKEAKLQLDLLKKDKSRRESWADFYFFRVVQSFWTDGDFAISLGKKKWKFYAVYPARTMMEKMLKLLYFVNQSLGERDKITKKEFLRTYMRIYLFEKKDGGMTESYEERYKEIDDKNEFPKINDVSEKDLKAFKDYSILCSKSGLKDADDLYFDYRCLSGLPHGDLIALESIRFQKLEEYRRSITLIVRFCIEVLKLTDSHLFKTIRKNIKDAIDKTQEIIEKPFNTE